MIRPIAGVLVLAMAVVSSAECFAAMQMTPDQHACCAAMKGECEMAVSASCCPTDTTEPGVVAAKPAISLVPAAVLVAVLSVPPVAVANPSHVIPAPDASSSGPPGVPTYLFVSSFRI